MIDRIQELKNMIKAARVSGDNEYADELEEILEGLQNGAK